MRARLVLLGGQAIALGLMTAFLVVPVSALLLHRYGAGALPFAYLGLALAGIGVSIGVARAERRLSLAQLAEYVLRVYLLGVLAAWLLLWQLDLAWVVLPLLLLFPLAVPTGFALIVSQAGRLLDVRHLKALLPRVVAGVSAGFAVGGLAAAGLVRPLGGPVWLLPLDAGAAVLMLGFVRATAAWFPPELALPPEGAPDPGSGPERAAPAAGSRAGRRRLPADRLVAMILAYRLLSVAVLALLVFMVWERAATRYTDLGDLARFQGVLAALVGLTGVAFVTAVAGRLLARFGIGLGLAAAPAGVLVLLVLAVAVGYVSGPAGFAFFALVCGQLGVGIALAGGASRPSVDGSYQALIPAARSRARAMVERGAAPTGLGLVGVLLLAHDAVGLDVRAVAVVTLLLTVLWLGSGLRCYREYRVNLHDALAQHAWDPAALRIDDDASRAVVDDLLASPDPADVHAGLDALLDAELPGVGDQVTTLLADPDPVRRGLGLQVAARAGLMPQLPEVAPAAYSLLEDQDPAVRLTSAAYLVDLDGQLGDAGRVTWLWALGSPDAQLRRTALAIAAASPAEFFVPHLVSLAGAATVPGELVDALVAHAPRLQPVLEELSADPTSSTRVRDRLVQALGESGAPRLRDLQVADRVGPAVAAAGSRNRRVVGRHEAGDGGRTNGRPGDRPGDRTGGRTGGRADGRHGERTGEWTGARAGERARERAAVARALTAEAVRAARTLQVLGLLPTLDCTRPLQAALRDDLAASGRRVQAQLEVVEESTGSALAPTVLALVDPTLDERTRRVQLAGVAPVESRSLFDWLRLLVLDPEEYWREPWLRACALYATPSLLGDEAAILARRFVDDPDAAVAQTAAWVLQRVEDRGSLPSQRRPS